MDVSGISLNRSTFEERCKNIDFLRKLYLFYMIEMLVVFGWTVWVLSCETLGNWVVNVWWLALVTGILAIILLLVCTFLPFARNSPINIVLYALFTIFFAYTLAYLAAINWEDAESGVVFYWICLFTVLSIAFFLQAW
jgi:FtsH-binding integral membrane protein